MNKKSILVVEDDVSVRESVRKVLNDAGYEVALAAGGLEALARFASQPIDLVLLDIGLPNRNGWETCRHVAREYSKVPIIVITGQAGQFKSALAFGASALMEKPLDAQRLLGMLQELLEKPGNSDRSVPDDTFYYVAK
jgi:two-component system, OmpR family, response regulator